MDVSGENQSLSLQQQDVGVRNTVFTQNSSRIIETVKCIPHRYVWVKFKFHFSYRFLQVLTGACTSLWSKKNFEEHKGS